MQLYAPRNVKEGRYTFEAFVTYTGREAISTQDFEVQPKDSAGVDTLFGKYGLYVILGLVIVAILVRRRVYTSSR